ncbi:Cathepsin L-like cysteine proteinase [Meloidogyne graminicola]|uniref:Cathepsin L-like cysteine proteinase n=1 Tax=Meloidogyne graminicola TaxID=189291 RepID=A0A8S9ZM78_9BILA|nr:Cathepsin L-like cysteine proteinase [Meloidogyne graminicola]
MALYENKLSLSEEPLVANKKSKKQRLFHILWLIIRIIIIAIVIAIISQLLWSFVFSNVFNSFRKLYYGKGGRFQKFQIDYNREYESDKEHWERFLIFEENYKKIQKLNEEAKKLGNNVTYGINSMTDMSDNEFREVSNNFKNFKMLLPLNFFYKLRDNARFIRKMTQTERNNIRTEHPSHFDWRTKGVVTPVKAQGKCGSCWAFASVATTESAYAVAHGVLRSLSEQELLDCNLENNACNGGNVDRAFSFIHETGLVSEGEYPYVAKRQPECLMNERSKNLTKIESALFINPDEDSIIDWILNFGPVNVVISVPPDMKPYKSGIYHPSDYDCQFRVVGLHSLLVVGFGITDNGQKYWIVKNSWGDDWGQENGYVNFIRGVNSCGIEDEPIGLLA